MGKQIFACGNGLLLNVLWPYTRVYMAPIDNLWWRWDPRLLSYSFEQGKRLRSHALSYRISELFHKQKFVLPWFLWPYRRVSVAAIDNLWWVYDPRLLLYSFEQVKRLRGSARSSNVLHHFSFLALYNQTSRNRIY